LDVDPLGGVRETTTPGTTTLSLGVRAPDGRSAYVRVTNVTRAAEPVETTRRPSVKPVETTRRPSVELVETTVEAPGTVTGFRLAWHDFASSAVGSLKPALAHAGRSCLTPGCSLIPLQRASQGSATPRCRVRRAPRRACRPSRADGGCGRRWRPW